MRELDPGSYAEFPEYLAEVVVHRAGADEQLLGDVAVGRAVGGQVRDAGLLGSEVEFGLRGPRPGFFAGGAQFTSRLFGEAGRAHGVEHVLGGAELASRVAPSFGAPQPLAVQQVRAGEIEGSFAAPELADRLQVRCLGVAALGEQCLAAGPEPERPVRSRGPGPVCEDGVRAARYFVVAAAGGGFDQLGQYRLGVEGR